MKVIVLVNAAAGPVAGKKLDRTQLQQEFAGAGVQADVRIVPHGELTSAAKRAASEAVDAVVAAGGDGTIRTVAAVLVGGPMTLGILPCGTLNHFAKALHLPLPLAEAIATIAEGHVRRVDVGEVNGQTFVNNSSIGFYPEMVEDRDELRLRLGRSKWFAMLQAALRVFRRFPLVDVHVEVEGRKLDRRTPFVFVGNNRYEFDVLKLGARPYLDRGELSVYVACCESRLAMLRLVGRALLGRLRQADDFEAYFPPETQVATRRRRLAVALDGEVLHLTPPLVYRSRPRALAVLAPPPPPTS